MFSPPLGPAIYPRAVAPNRRPYRTLDGHISALIHNDKQWNAFVGAVRPPWAKDPGFATLALRAKRIDAVYALLADTLAERATQDWLLLFQSLDIPASPLRTPAELFDDSHLNAVGLIETVETQWGPVRFPSVPTWFSRTPGRVGGGPPELGAHTEEVLRELNM